MSDGGKGSTPRPFVVDHKTYSDNWERTFGKKKKMEQKNISIISDLHLSSGFINSLIGTGDILIVAGDLVASFETFKSVGQDYLLEAKKRYNRVLYVAGNHEFYVVNPDKPTYNECLDYICNWCADNGIDFLGGKNNTIEIDGVKYFGGVMWSDLEPPHFRTLIPIFVNDFRLIETKNGKFTTDDCLKLNAEFREKLLKSDADVVITHFPPSNQSMDFKFAGNSLNSYFYNSGLDEFIENSNIKLWVHGHTHASCDYHIGETRVVCNPIGYFGETKNISPKKVVLEVE